MKDALLKYITKLYKFTSNEYREIWTVKASKWTEKIFKKSQRRLKIYTVRTEENKEFWEFERLLEK